MNSTMPKCKNNSIKKKLK